MLINLSTTFYPDVYKRQAIYTAIQEALKAKEEGRQKTILFNLSGHGLIDMAAYDRYFDGELSNHELADEEIVKTTNTLEHLVP